MTRTVWKYDINVKDAAAELGIVIALPAQAKFLASAFQYSTAFVTTWFEVNPDMPKVRRRFQLFGTGHPIDDGLSYLSSHSLHSGELILHLYQATEGEITG